MKIFNGLLIGFIGFVGFVGCAHCGQSDDAPYIRTQPGIEYCGEMCQKFTDMKCTGYYEPLAIDCKKDLAM